MVLSEQHFRGHVAGRPAGFMSIFCLPVPGDAEVSDPGVSVLIEDDIFRLDVAVDDVSLVQVVEPLDQTPNQKL